MDNQLEGMSKLLRTYLQRTIRFVCVFSLFGALLVGVLSEETGSQAVPREEINEGVVAGISSVIYTNGTSNDISTDQNNQNQSLVAGISGVVTNLFGSTLQSSGGSSYVTGNPEDESEIIEEIIEDEVIEEEEVVEEFIPTYSEVGYVNALDGLNARSSCDTSDSSNILGKLRWATQVNYSTYTDDAWAVIMFKDQQAYISKEFIQQECPVPPVLKSVDVSGDQRKSYESYDAVGPYTRQGILQSNAYTDPATGIRMVGDRYCVAVGSAFSSSIGQYMDVILANGVTIPCIMGDQKSNAHTDSRNMIAGDGSCVEFMVDTSAISPSVRQSGNCNDVNWEWNSEVIGIVVYDYIY